MVTSPSISISPNWSFSHWAYIVTISPFTLDVFATLVQKYIAHLEDLTDQQKRLADVDGDGEITILDATEIQKMLANVKNKEA